jgi:methionine-gamma-lyase
MSEKDGFSTKSVHSGEKLCPLTGSITTPIYQTSNFGFPDLDSLKETLADPSKGFFYTRLNNPTFETVETKLADLMGAQKAAVFSSGMAALTTSILSLVSAGDHIVSISDVYGGTFNFFANILPRYGVTVDLCDTTDPEQLSGFIKPNTKLVFFETPTNPLLKIIDISKLVDFAREKGIITFIDNTFASPYNQSPLKWGIDLEMQSATKYLGGHSDLLAGVVGGKEELMAGVKNFRYVLGGIPDPHSAWLLMRGAKTLKVRMDAHNTNGMNIARFLQQHPLVDKVYYPGLPDHPQHDIARKQMRGFGGMVGFEIREQHGVSVESFLRKLRIFRLAVSLGGVESLVSPPVFTTHRKLTESQRARAGIRNNLIRLSAGIEESEDLIDDLAQALNP